MEKINIAELLRDCPTGMELDCMMYDNLYFDRVDTIGDIICYIKSKDGCLTRVSFHENGCYNTISNAKCVIFPKGKTTWKGFHRPFKDGDILATNNGSFIAIVKNNGGKYYCCCHTNGSHFVTDYSGWFDRFATEEEKQRLFDIIKERGYRWNPETKTLEKLINKNKFVVGATITNGKIISKIVSRDVDSYKLEDGNYVFFDEVHNWELVPNKFKEGDIITSLNTSIYIFTNRSSIVNEYFFAPCGLIADSKSENHYFKVGTISISIDNMRHATEEEKEKLFKAIKDNGYRWNTETKTLVKLTKFKVGDRIRHKDDNGIYCTLGEYSDGISAYRTNIGLSLTYKDLEQWELAPNKFDISKLKPYDKVLVRDKDTQKWGISFFDGYNGLETYKYSCINSSAYAQCIPYKGNEHLRNTTNECDKFFKVWEE